MSEVEFVNTDRAIIASHAGGATLPLPEWNTLHSLGPAVKNKAAIRNLQWRGCGGVLPTSSGVEFDRQLDKISLWMESWSHQQTCCILEELLRHSNCWNTDFLSTVLQPSLHRDFMYTARSRFPEMEFSPVSTYITRRLKDKLRRRGPDTFCRVGSAYRQTDEDVQRVKLPLVLDKSSRVSKSAPDALSLRSHAKRCNHRKATQSHKYTAAQNIGKWIDAGTTHSSDTSVVQHAAFRFTKMPVRRHIQNEQMMMKQENKSTEASVSSKASTEKYDSLTILSNVTLPDEGRQIIQWYSNMWNDTKRNEFLHKLILKLDPRQHYFLSNVLSIKQHKDIIGLLPEKLALNILKYLAAKELLIACQVNKKWSCLANANNLWKFKCKEATIEVPIPSNPIWKDVFKKNLYLRFNWKNGLFKTMDFCGHTRSVLCVAYDSPYLASGSADKTIKVWDIETGKLKQTLTGHSGGIWCIQFFTTHLLISGSFDHTIRIWNLRTKTTTRTLLGHNGQIWCLKRQGLLLVSGSQDRTAKIWDIGRCLLVHTLRGHCGAIFSVDVSENGRLVITASADKSIRLWMAETGQLFKIVSVSPSTSVMSVSYSQGYLACSYDSVVCLYRGDKLLRSFEEHSERVECVKLKITDAKKGEGYIVSSGKDGLIKYWDTKNANSVQTFKGHDEAVKCLWVNSFHIISASSDTKVRLWDFNIGMPTEKTDEEEEDLAEEDNSDTDV